MDRAIGWHHARTDVPAVNEEAAFVAELRAGSQDAFAYLLAVYQNPVFNLVWHIVENQPTPPTFCKTFL